MTVASLPPLRLPASRRPGPAEGVLARRPLRLPRLPAAQPAVGLWGFTTVDASGRLAAGDLVRALGWVPWTRLEVAELSGLLVVAEAGDGRLVVTGRGHVSLPVGVRRWHGLEAGTRVLLVADLDGDRLVVHPPAALTGMIMRLHAEVFGGVQ